MRPLVVNAVFVVVAPFLRPVHHFCTLFPHTAQPQKGPTPRSKDSAAPPQVRDGTAGSLEDFACKDHAVHSYQQISCLDSVIR